MSTSATSLASGRFGGDDNANEYCAIRKQISLRRQGSNPNVLNIKELSSDPVIEKDHKRYVPDPTYYSRNQRKICRTKSNPEQKVGSLTDLCKKEDTKTITVHGGELAENNGVVIREQPGLHYFAYLGPGREYSRQRCGAIANYLSPRNALAEKPVIVTATSVVLPDATSRAFGHGGKDVFEFTSSDECIGHYESADSKNKSGCEDIIDCCSCMCCAKAVLYHCTKDSDGEGTMADKPCTCQGTRSECLGRWGALGVLTLFLPCLLCYIPLEGCNRCCLRLQRCAGSPQSSSAK